MKKRTSKPNAQPSPAPLARDAARQSEPRPAAGNRPPWRQTLGLLGGGWAALVVMALLWRLWTGNPLIIYFSAGAIGMCYTLAVLFDHFRPRAE